MNEIESGRKLDKALFYNLNWNLQVPQDLNDEAIPHFSSKINDAMVLIQNFCQDDHTGFAITFQKLTNFQECKVTIFDYFNEKVYMGVSGSVPFAICLAFIQMIKDTNDETKWKEFLEDAQ